MYHMPAFILRLQMYIAARPLLYIYIYIYIYSLHSTGSSDIFIDIILNLVDLNCNLQGFKFALLLLHLCS